MRARFWIMLAATIAIAALSSPLLAGTHSGSGTTDALDDAWAERALADPSRDEGWSQNCRDDWREGLVGYCAVREFSYPKSELPVAIHGGQNGGMTVMGTERVAVRILYRVMARARTEARARALAEEITLEMTKGWLRPEGPVSGSQEWWSVEIKAWVPRATDLILRTHNGPLAVRGVEGTMALHSTNGPVSLVDVGGAVEARVTNGPLHVSLGGTRWNGKGLDAAAENGPVNLEVPSGYSARLVTGTIRGPRSIEYSVPANRAGDWISTTLGRGGPPVRVVTTNGPFHIGRR